MSVLVCGCSWCLFVVAVVFVVASPWSVFLFPGSASSLGCQALHDAGHCRAPSVSAGQTEEAVWRGNCTSSGVCYAASKHNICLDFEFVLIYVFVIYLFFIVQHATELVKTVASRYDEYVNVKDLSDKISRALTAAKKDNDFIYHDRVPEVKDLEHIGKATLVKATAIQVPLSQKFSGEYITDLSCIS